MDCNLDIYAVAGKIETLESTWCRDVEMKVVKVLGLAYLGSAGSEDVVRAASGAI